MRLPWPVGAQEPLRTWLVCGEFPLPTAFEGDVELPQPQAGFANDYLQRHGGEARIRPVEGMAHARPNGTITAWKSYQTPTDSVSYAVPFFTHPQDNLVWYAFTTIQRPVAGPAALAVSSSQSLKIWVNGALIHEHYLDRPMGYDDLVKVDLQAGENAVLVKVLQRKGPGSFSLRILETAQAEMQEATTARLNPNIIPGEPGILTVLTDDRRRDFATSALPVLVEVLAPGGHVVATATVPQGARALFPTAGWADGPYEVRCSTTGVNGKMALAYRSWYRGDPVAAAQQLAANADPSDRTPAGMTHTLLAEMLKERAGGNLAKISPALVPDLYPLLMEAAELEMGDAGVRRPNGCVRLAWRDEVDDSPQFCRVYLPRHFDPTQKYPLIVSLHGRADDFPPYSKWSGSAQRHDGTADQYPVIVAYPHGRGNSWYRGMGDRDVMRCVAMIKERFAIDADRVYLTGFSMGGAGTWYVGTRHPDTFAALAPFYGGYDFRFQLADAALDALSDRERFRRERLSYIAQAEGLLTTPVFASHGDVDGIVPVDYSRYTVRLLERWGYNVRYAEYPAKGHGGISAEPATEWLLAQRRVSNPPKVKVRAADLRSASAHWVRIEQRKDPYAFMQASAEVLAPNYLRLDTDNVLQITLSPAAPLIDPTKPITVLWNGTDRRTVPMENGALTLRARGYLPPALVKRPELAGPMSDIYTTPVALVIGTISPDPLMRRMCARAAERMLLWWDERHHAPLRCFRDTELTEEQAAQYSLLLFGGPDDNQIARQLADRLPLKIAPYAITIDGKTFRAYDAAVQVVYPNPLNPDRYVVIRAGTSPTGMFFSDYVLNDTDFSIVDARNADPARLGEFFDIVSGPNSGPVLAAGYFNYAWHLEESGIERDTERADPARWTVPAYATAAITTADRLYLSELVETRADGAFLEMVRDGTADGKPLTLARQRYARGLSLPGTYWLPKRPCLAEFDLTGGQWTALRGVIGLETGKYNPAQSANTRVVFVVRGDGIELYRSEPFTLSTPPKSLDLDITGIRTLQLEVVNTTVGAPAFTAIDWADIRVERTR